MQAFAGGQRVPAESGLIEASDGFLYGTTLSGAREGGSIFRMAKSGELTVLHDFAPVAVPGGAGSVYPAFLVEGADGSIYGSTAEGGEHQRGSVFRITKAGALTTLHSFADANGAFLLQASDGIYGYTPGDIAKGPTVFRVDSEGGLDVIHDGPLPGLSSITGSLAEGPDGALYGLGEGTAGGLFRLSKNGIFSLEYSFSASSDVGYAPRHGLIRSADGMLYGSTDRVLFQDAPTVFRFEPATKQVTIVARVHGTALTEGPDGALYTWGWATPGAERQTLFRIKDGGVSVLHAAAHEDGRIFSRVVHGNDGALYGTVMYGPWRPSEPETWTTDTFAGGVWRVTLPAGQ
jgi:uncharacterized repeat protein (TIGR03803 family)